MFGVDGLWLAVLAQVLGLLGRGSCGDFPRRRRIGAEGLVWGSDEKAWGLVF